MSGPLGFTPSAALGLLAAGGGGGNAFVQGGNAFGALAVFGTTDAFDVSMIRGGVAIATLAASGFYVNVTTPLFDEVFRVAKAYNADNAQHETATITTDVGGAAVSTGLFVGDDGILNLFGTADYSAALAYSRGGYVAYYATGGASGPALLVGDYAQATLGDPAGATNPLVVPNVAAVYVRSSQFAFGRCGRASATMATGYYIFPPLASDALHTVVDLSGVYVDDQGALGITNPMGYDAKEQTRGGVFSRAISPRRAQNISAAPAAPPAGAVDTYCLGGSLLAQDAAGVVTVLAP